MELPLLRNNFASKAGLFDGSNLELAHKKWWRPIQSPKFPFIPCFYSLFPFLDFLPIYLHPISSVQSWQNTIFKVSRKSSNHLISK